MKKMLPRSLLMPGGRERAVSDTSGHVGQMKEKIQGMLKPCSPKRYLCVVLLALSEWESVTLVLIQPRPSPSPAPWVFIVLSHSGLYCPSLSHAE